MNIQWMGKSGEICESHSVDGVRYDLATTNDGFGLIRVFDEDSGNVVTLKMNPSFRSAQSEYDRAVFLARRCAVNPQTELFN